MSFAEQLATLNEWHFFREFTYSKTTFRPSPTQELELADSLVWIGNLLLAYQVKERMLDGDTDPDQEARWFERKVLGRATRQVRDTLTYLESHEAIVVRNHRGHAFELR